MSKIKDAMERGDYPIVQQHNINKEMLKSDSGCLLTEYQTYTLIGEKKFYRKNIDEMDDNSADTEYERSKFNEDFESKLYPSEGFL